MTPEHHLYRLVGQRTPMGDWLVISTGSPEEGASPVSFARLLERLARAGDWYALEIRALDADEALASWVRPHNS